MKHIKTSYNTFSTPTIGSLLIILSFLMTLGCSGMGNSGKESSLADRTSAAVMADLNSEIEFNAPTDGNKETKPKVTFIELGSVRCIPCQKMVPIMESVENKFGNQIKVVFYDVWTPEGKPYGEKYKIKVIPTQIFLDENGDEYFRHEGFFPEDELVKVLQKKGVE